MTKKNVYRYRYMFILAIPGLLYFLIFKIAPLWGLSFAFVDYNPLKGLFASEFVGFKNFIDLFKSDKFLIMLRNTIVISMMNLLLFFPAPIILALLINEIKGKHFKKVTQTIVYLPHFLSWVVIAGITFFIFSSDIGLVNKAIIANGGEPVGFLSNPKLFWWFLLGQTTWKEIGWESIIFLAAITQIDVSLYEAAEVDGASRMQKLRYITLSGIMPTVVTMFIIKLGTIFDISLDQILMMKNSFVEDVAEVFDTYAYMQGIMQGNLSLGVTVGIFKGLICMAFIIVSNTVIKKMGYDGIY